MNQDKNQYEEEGKREKILDCIVGFNPDITFLSDLGVLFHQQVFSGYAIPLSLYWLSVEFFWG